MKSVTVLLARAVAFFDLSDLTPRGGLHFLDVGHELISRYGFQKSPQTLEDWKNDKGAEFLAGKAGTHVISKLLMWQTGITLETNTSTEVSKQILEEILGWGKEKLGITYSPDMLKHWAYISDLSFYSDVELLSSPPVSRLAEKTSKAISDVLGEPLRYEPMVISIGHDPLARKYGRAPFSIQRRAESPFSDHKYFSEAPLPTDLHIRLLTEFESDVANQESRK